MSYQLMLFPPDESNKVNITVAFECDKDNLAKVEAFTEQDIARLKTGLEAIEHFEGDRIHESEKWLGLEVTRTGHSLDPELGDAVALTLAEMVSGVTPMVLDVENSRNEQ